MKNSGSCDSDCSYKIKFQMLEVTLYTWTIAYVPAGLNITFCEWGKEKVYIVISCAFAAFLHPLSAMINETVFK